MAFTWTVLPWINFLKNFHVVQRQGLKIHNAQRDICMVKNVHRIQSLWVFNDINTRIQQIHIERHAHSLYRTRLLKNVHCIILTTYSLLLSLGMQAAGCTHTYNLTIHTLTCCIHYSTKKKKRMQSRSACLSLESCDKDDVEIIQCLHFHLALAELHLKFPACAQGFTSTLS